MVYSNVVREILDSLGGTENIVTINRTRTELTIVVFNDAEINVERLRRIHPRIKKVQILRDRIIFYLQKRDVTGLFEAFKELPNSEITKLKDTYQEEEPDNSHLTYLQLLENAVFGDFLPMLLGMCAIGGILGFINFIGHIAS